MHGKHFTYTHFCLLVSGLCSCAIWNNIAPLFNNQSGKNFFMYFNSKMILLYTGCPIAVTSVFIYSI